MILNPPTDPCASEIISILVSALTASIAIIISIIVYVGQKQLAKRQFIIPIWQYMATLDSIDPNKVIIPNLIKVINTLELIAVSCEGKMIDKKIILRVFAHQYVLLYEQIQSCGAIPSLNNKTGQMLLNECPAVISFYNDIKEYLIKLTRP